MLLIGALLLVAGGLVWASPRLLSRGTWQMRRPALALGVWHAAFVVGAAAACGSVAVAVMQTIMVTRAAHGTAVVATVTGWVALGVVGAAVAAATVGSGAVGDASRRNRGALLALPHSARALDHRTELRVCDSTEVFACSVPDTRGTIVITTALADLLTPAQLRAVVAHEHAHLRRRHHLAMRLADANVACLPRSRAGHRLRRSTALLIELMADDNAARTAGAVHLANALVRIADATGDQMMLLRAERLSRRPWRPASHLAPLPALYSSLGRGISA